MTRINVVPARELHDKHLLAEYRELPRVFALAHSWWMQGGRLDELPPSYTMGSGHVRFFYDKLRWCARRHQELVQEMKRRKFKTNYDRAPSIMIKQLDNDWTPTSVCIAINRERLAARLSEMQERSRTRSGPSS